ncbi:uncharacterized mitochondrial protein AtMg00810-like [Salvia splendens]|uniref:uncharacterized mitochondrial protein AtMg00810-like n=1 Tax=Salvia splendens TaxID=180675 RepID=UPI001C279A88|nr:uncharacterized mitochondrial protein AtMg00810-like [Salvia splendens]
MDAYFIDHGFERSKSESTLYVKTQDTSTLIVALYVDALLFCGDDEKMIHDFKIEMMKRYEMSDMGLLHHFLGMEIYQENDGVFICQRKYAENILKKFGMSDCNPTLIPLAVNQKMKKEDGEKKIDACIYRSMSESTLSWCNKERVLRYIKDLTNFGIKYVKGAQVNLQGYCDSDWAGCLDDMKSTTGHSFSLGSSVFSWTSKKQESVAQSTAEAGYVAAAMATSHVYWLRKILGDIGMNRTRHINIKYHFIREAIEECEVQLTFSKSEDQVADIFTKSLPKEKFFKFRELLGVMEHHIKRENCS